jgi:hypothetical protein
MIQPRQHITINGGEEVLLFLPSMFSIAKQRKLSLVVRDANDPFEIQDLYIRIIYLAYLTSWEQRKYDGRVKGEPTLHIEDFNIWAYENKERFAELANLIVEFLTGKPASEIVSEDAKKKEKEPKEIKDRFLSGLRRYS